MERERGFYITFLYFSIVSEGHSLLECIVDIIVMKVLFPSSFHGNSAASYPQPIPMYTVLMQSNCNFSCHSFSHLSQF